MAIFYFSKFTKPFAILTLLLVFSCGVSAQPVNIKISDQNFPEEPSIFINPKNPAKMMAGANIDNLFLSSDSGLTWSQFTLTSNFGVWGDPCIAADTSGDFVFLHLANPPSGSWIDRIVFQKYQTTNSTWVVDTFAGLNGSKFQDKEWIAIDPATNFYYITWTEFDDYGSSASTDSSRIMFSKSLDGGVSWSPAQKINKTSGDCIDSDNTTEGAVPTVGPNGEIFVAWAGPDGLVFDRSLDTGKTWLENDIFVSSIPGGWDYAIDGISRCNGLPITICDLSNGPHHGTIYINWTDQRNGINNTDVWLVKSTDGGNTWSAPFMVNDDTTQNQQFLTWMSVDQTTGDIYIIFYDRRAYPDTRTDVTVAVSKDGGSSFKNYKISHSPFQPTPNIFFGDYNNISAHNGIVRPIWTRLNNDSLSVWTAIINSESDLSTKISYNTFGEVETQAYPVPSNDLVSFSYKVKTHDVYSLNIVDANGKQVVKIFESKELTPGFYMEKFSASANGLSSGVYYFSLKSAGSETVRKIIIN